MNLKENSFVLGIFTAVLGLNLHIFLGVHADDSLKLMGVCDYQSTKDTCSVYASLEGQRPIQILGQGFTQTAQDQKVMFKYTLSGTNLASPGPAITRDFNYKSDISRGVLYYEAPSLKQLLGDSIASKTHTLSTEIYVQGPSAGGTTSLFSCDTASACTVQYGLAYTPQVLRIYPSTVYAGQDICFNVFTDNAANGRPMYVSAKIGENTMSFEAYDERNTEVTSTWNDYQICGTAGGGPAQENKDLTIISGTGKYLVTDLAKSYDGAKEYLIRTIPSVNGVSAHTLYKAGGGILIIKGDGFRAKVSENEVTVDGVVCKVFEASETQLKCVLEAKTGDTTGTAFVGGTGARVKEFSGYTTSTVKPTTIPTKTLYYTDIESRRDSDENDQSLVRVVEGWFVPPQNGKYIFHAACDDSCTLDLSTEDMNKDAATKILTAGLRGWRNFWEGDLTSISSDEITLEKDKHYYFKVTHAESNGNDYMTVGFTINDESTAHPNSQKGWKSITIDPHHTFEVYEVTVPTTPDVNYRLQFANIALKCSVFTKASDIFQCNTKDCPCVTGSFKATSSADSFRTATRDFFNKIRSNYGNHMKVTKEGLDASGAVTTVVGDIVSYKFTATAIYAISSASSTDVKIFASTGTTGTVAKTGTSTLPISGKFKIKIPLAAGGNAVTEDLALDLYNGNILREIYSVAPEYIGKIEMRTVYSKFPSQFEGKEFYYRINGSPSVDLEIIASTTSPLTGGDATTPIEYLSNPSLKAASNKPFYEVIPGSMVRSFETKSQIIVKSGGILGACPISETCDATFVNDVGEITARTINFAKTEITFVGTAIPASEITYVAVSTSRRCELDPSNPVTATGFK